MKKTRLQKSHATVPLSAQNTSAAPPPLQTAVDTEQIRNLQECETYGIHVSGTKMIHHMNTSLNANAWFWHQLTLHILYIEQSTLFFSLPTEVIPLILFNLLNILIFPKMYKENT